MYWQRLGIIEIVMEGPVLEAPRIESHDLDFMMPSETEMEGAADILRLIIQDQMLLLHDISSSPPFQVGEISVSPMQRAPGAKARRADR